MPAINLETLLQYRHNEPMHDMFAYLCTVLNVMQISAFMLSDLPGI